MTTEPEKTIWRYTLPITDHHEIDMPAAARVLTAQRRGSDRELDVWAYVDPSADLEPVTFRTAGTGHPIGPAPHPRGLWRDLSTVQVADAQLVFHVFVQELVAS